MSTNLQTCESKEQIANKECAEELCNVKTLIPRSDIFESQEKITLISELPGATAKTVDITLENNTLTITASVESHNYEGYSLALSEYSAGKYQRSFTLSNGIDRDGIEASVKNGILTLTLPKSKALQPKRIEVTQSV